MSEVISFRDVEVRTWPERTDVLVIDPSSFFTLAQYEIQDPSDPLRGTGPLFSPVTPYQERSLLAVHAVEQDQEGLRRYFLLEDESVCLRPTEESRQKLSEVLSEYGFSFEDVEIANLASFQKELERMSLDHFWLFLADWHDVVERRYPAGTSASDPWSWLQRSRPEGCLHFHMLASSKEKEASDDEAYEELQSVVDVSLRDFSLGLFLRWIYFHRAEFPDRDIPAMRSLQELSLQGS